MVVKITEQCLLCKAMPASVLAGIGAKEAVLKPQHMWRDKSATVLSFSVILW